MIFLVLVACFVVAMVVIRASNQLSLRSLQAIPNEHWTERARRLYPITRSAALNVWLVSLLCALFVLYYQPDDLQAPIFVFLFAFAGAVLGTYPYTKTLFPQFTFRTWARYVVGMRLVRIGLIGFFVGVMIVMPDEFGWENILLAAAAVAMQVLLNFNGWILLLRLARLLGPPTARLSEIVQRTSDRMKIPCRAVWVLVAPVGYAAALPATGDLIFSEGLIESHPDDEIAAVCAHELAHVSESRLIVLGRIVGSLSVLPLLFWRPAYYAFDFGGIVLLLVPTTVLMVFARRLSRKMEVRADAIAKQNEDPGAYARALERLYRMNHLPAVMPGKRKTHPHLYDRLLAAGVTPDYPRPEPPKGICFSSRVLIFLLATISALAIVGW